MGGFSFLILQPGESVSITKHTDAIPDPRAVNQDKKNMLFSVSPWGLCLENDNKKNPEESVKALQGRTSSIVDNTYKFIVKY